MSTSTLTVPNRLLQTRGHSKSRTDTCGICTDEMTPQCATFIHIDCHTSYHRDCLTVWIDTPGNTCPACRQPVANKNLVEQLKSIEVFAMDVAPDMDDAVTKVVAPTIEDLEPNERLQSRSVLREAQAAVGGDVDPAAVEYWSARAAKKITLGEVEFWRRPGYVEQQRYYNACLAAEEEYHQACIKASPRLAMRSQELDRMIFGLLCFERYVTQYRLWSHVVELEIAIESNGTLNSTLNDLARMYDAYDPMKLRAAFHGAKAGLLEVRLSGRRMHREQLVAGVEGARARYNQAVDAARVRLEEAKDDVGLSGGLWEANPPDPRNIPSGQKRFVAKAVNATAVDSRTDNRSEQPALTQTTTIADQQSDPGLARSSSPRTTKDKEDHDEIE